MYEKRKSEKIFETLLKISKKVSSSLEPEKVGNMILKQVKSILHTDYSALFALSEDLKHLILIGAKGFKADQIENLKILAGWERINVELARKGKAIIVNDISKSITFKHKKIPFSGGKLPLGAFLAVPLKTDSRIIGALIVSNHKKRKGRFTDDDRKLLYTLANHVSIALLNARLYKDLRMLFLNTITSLVAAIEAKDHYTRGHSERVARYAIAIAEEIHPAPTFLEDLRLSGILHDVGKIGISDNILLKKTALNKKELKKIHEHPVIGSRIVNAVIKSKGILSGIAEHHEHFNGKGYPKRLKGKNILLEGRIMAVADAFDSLTTDRPYRNAFSAKDAFLEIVKSAKTQFDPRIVKAFKASFSKHPELWQVK